MNNYVFRSKATGCFYGSFTAQQVLNLNANGKYLSVDYELFELVKAKIIPPNEARVVRA